MHGQDFTTSQFAVRDTVPSRPLLLGHVIVKQPQGWTVYLALYDRGTNARYTQYNPG